MSQQQRTDHSKDVKTFLTEKRITKIFNEIDVEQKGYLTIDDLLNYRHRIKPAETGKVERIEPTRKLRRQMAKELMAEMNIKTRISQRKFMDFLYQKERQLLRMFHDLDAQQTGRLTSADIRLSLQRAGVTVSEEDIEAFVLHVDLDEDGLIDFQELLEFCLFLPKNITTLREIYSYYLNIVHQSDTMDFMVVPTSTNVKLKSDPKQEKSVLSSRKGVTMLYLLAGAIAGAVSRTATAPLDRIRVLLQVQTACASTTGTLRQRVRNFLHGFWQIYADGGVTAFWRGNGVNVVKIIPESATRFYVYESVKAYLKESSGSSSSIVTMQERMIAGGVAGFASQCLIYPLETIKTRMMAEMSSAALQYSSEKKISKEAVERRRVSAIKTAKGIIEKNGYRAFFRGIGTSLIGIIPYASIDLTAYETLKSTYTTVTGDKKPSTSIHLICGALAGTLSATVVYPLGLIRTRQVLQAQGTSGHTETYPRGAIDVIQRTMAREGLKGFYKGLAPTLIKVVPAVSISYITYEKSKQWLGLQ